MTPKLFHKIALAVLTLLVVAFLIGFIYVYNSDGSTNLKARSSQASAVDTSSPIKPPPKPGPNAQVGVAEEAFDSPAAPGATTSIIINTTAGANCSITVTLNGVKDNAASLKPQVADAFGNVTWSWTIPSNTPFGSYPVSVKCAYGKNWAVFNDFLIVKQ